MERNKCLESKCRNEVRILLLIIGLCFMLVGCGEKKKMLSTSNQFIGATRDEIKKTYGSNPTTNETDQMVYENISDYNDDIIYGSVMANVKEIKLDRVEFDFDSQNECIEQRTYFDIELLNEEDYGECNKLISDLITQEREGYVTYELDDYGSVYLGLVITAKKI